MTSSTCQGTTKAGNPCKNAPLVNSDYCRQHQPEEVTESPVMCGHWNAHYTDGDMTCDLPAGHEGDHSAEFHAIDYKDGLVSFEGMKRTYWKDEASVPADQIKPDMESLLELIRIRKEKEEARLMGIDV